MKYIKEFEKINSNKPQVGDYVICSGEYYVMCAGKYNNKDIENSIKNNIGTLKVIDDWRYVIKYKNHWYDEYLCTLDDILYWSKDKEELGQILTANKFNI